jgi:L-lactate dehydrogenase complex protein LldG
VTDAARDAVLARIRGALRDVPADEPLTGEGRELPPLPGRGTPPVPSPTAGEALIDPAPASQARTPASAPADGPADRVRRFIERVEDYRAVVVRCEEAEVPVAVAAACERHGARRLVIAPGVPGAWLPPAVEPLRDDPPLPVAEIDAADGVITGAASAIAETGTFILDGGALSGRRVITLVPDLHICVVRAADIVASVPDAVSGLHEATRAGRAVTFVSGPSATSDIELDRVEGVHGPRRLEVIVAG